QSVSDTRAATAAHCIDRAALARFQLARSLDDPWSVFGPADSPCRPLVVRALAGTQPADLHGLIPAFVVFFIAAALALAGPRSRWAWVAIAATMVAGAANVIEDEYQLQVFGSVEDATGFRAPLHIATLTKFFALAVCGAAIGIWALRRFHPTWALGL